MPKVSVIIPVYNVEKYLAQCLDSVVSQTLQDIEIICIADDSPDNSINILKEYAKKDHRIIVIQQRNRGSGGARNGGMSIATGEYIGFVDGDDWIESNYFEELYSAATKYNADIACCSFVRNYPSGKVSARYTAKSLKVYTSMQQKFDAAKIPRCCHVWNKIYHKQLLQKIKFDEHVAFEDVVFGVEAMYKCHRLVTVPGTKYHYRVNRKSITRAMDDKIRVDLLNARRKSVEFMQKHNIRCDEKFCMLRKVEYKIFNVPLLTIKEWHTYKRYYIFSAIKIFEKEVGV